VLIRIAVVLLIAWIIDVLGVYRPGTLVHILLLIGLMLLLLGFLRARDAAVRRNIQSSSDKP
jgi:hypothetical protein